MIVLFIGIILFELAQFISELLFGHGLLIP
jgi:hypothetical protein